jgi:cyclopropane-fatty-acyl-phospholipid synthase
MASAATAPKQGLRSRTAESVVVELLSRAGVTVGGDAAHDVEVRDRRFYARLLRDGALGMGESYMEGWWDSPALDQMLVRIVRAKLEREVRTNPRLAAQAIAARVVNMQRRSRATHVAKHHYDANDDVYAAMLDADRIYSCGYWREADALEAAQQAKLDLVCRKLGLREGMTVLDIGCGWGGFAKFAAERYGVRVTATNIAAGQVEYARRACAGLDVEIRLEDYRDTRGSFDAIVSVGMFEHVGFKNYGAFMETVERCLSVDGVALLHTIAGNLPSVGGPWIKKYIFPNGHLPTLAQIAQASEGLLVIEDVHNFGPDYDRTLMEWDRRFESAWPTLAGNYDERFRRMWRYYLLSSAAGFRSRNIQLFQVALTRTGAPSPDARQV